MTTVDFKIENVDNTTSHYFSGKPFSENQITQLTNIGCKVDHVPRYVTSSTYTGIKFIQDEFTVVKTTTEKHEVILKFMTAS
jgi:hypothetical protein